LSLFFVVIVPAGLFGHVLPLDASVASAAERRLVGEVDVLLAVQSHQEGGYIDDLLADADVTLADEDTGVVDRLGESQLEDLGLEPPLQEVLDLEAEHEIELHVILVEDTDADQAPEQCIALEQPPGILLVKGQEFTGRLPDVGQDELDPPDLALVAEPKLADKLQLLVETGLLEGPAWGREDLGGLFGDTTVHHDSSSTEEAQIQKERNWGSGNGMFKTIFG